MNSRIHIELLGQSGCRLMFPEITIYIDPYLSDSVQELIDPKMKRQIPIPFSPLSVTDANWVIITHDHLDHCDPHTLPQIANASPQARFLAPAPVIFQLINLGIDHNRITLAQEDWFDLGSNLTVRTIPAAHPNIVRDTNNNLLCVGYLFAYNEQYIYFAGDTTAHQDIIDILKLHKPIHTAFLPVNEHNFFRQRNGITGNMSPREALLFAQEIHAQNVVPIHWDMFAENAVDPSEVYSAYHQIKPNYRLLISPKSINLCKANASIIIRTLNESTYLDKLLNSINQQETQWIVPEVILVDSGSTDDTIMIAQRHGCRILKIDRSEFSFGRSLNRGCEAAIGEILIFISGHCIPSNTTWLESICKPIMEGTAEYSYGAQLGGENSRFSETRIFLKYFPSKPHISSSNIYCNNANAAISREAWIKFKFDEELTGLEDMDLAQRLAKNGSKIAYTPDASVIHHHNESWLHVQRRFEREAIALQRIMPQVHVSIIDMFRYFLTSVFKDWHSAQKQKKLLINFLEIVYYRWNQYTGTYKGNKEIRKLSHTEKEKYFYPQ